MKLEDLGISNSSIDHVDYSKKEQMKNLMRTRAMVNAKTRAVALTEPLHQKTGRAIYISDNESYVIHPMMKEATARFDVSANTAAPLPEINFEKIEISSSINVKFILE